jgi:hypothetical protein
MMQGMSPNFIVSTGEWKTDVYDRVGCVALRVPLVRIAGRRTEN